MDEVKYLSKQEVEAIHFLTMRLHDDLDQAGRDENDDEKVNLFESMLVMPQTEFYGQEQYAFPFEKAVCYYHTIARNHLFHNGNKRTAIFCLFVFLRINGWMLTIPSQKQAEDYTVVVAEDPEYKKDGSIQKIAIEMERSGWFMPKEHYDLKVASDPKFADLFYNPFNPPIQDEK